MQLDLRDRRAALVVVDIMAELAPGADETHALAVVGADVGIPNAVRVLEAARRHGMPVIHFKEVHRKEMVDFGRELDGTEPVHCLETWPETDYHPDTYPIDGELPMQKRRYTAA